ncbi:MAG: transposase family protein [Saprospirales bacterium]|nr:transposase family protein [Saprospirales bacterium]
MQYNLLEFLTDFSDPRRGQGQRHRLSVFLAMVIMAILSGHQGLKGFTRFMKNNEEELVSIFQLKHGVPSFGTVRTLLQSVSPEELATKILLVGWNSTSLWSKNSGWPWMGKPLVLRFKTHMDRYKVLSMWSVCLLSVAAWFIRWSTLKVARLMKKKNANAHSRTGLSFFDSGQRQLQ